jgi:hypothetical protein
MSEQVIATVPVWDDRRIVVVREIGTSRETTLLREEYIARGTRTWTQGRTLSVPPSAIFLLRDGIDRACSLLMRGRT